MGSANSSGGRTTAVGAAGGVPVDPKTFFAFDVPKLTLIDRKGNGKCMKTYLMTADSGMSNTESGPLIMKVSNYCSRNNMVVVCSNTNESSCIHVCMHMLLNLVQTTDICFHAQHRLLSIFASTILPIHAFP